MPSSETRAVLGGGTHSLLAHLDPASGLAKDLMRSFAQAAPHRPESAHVLLDQASCRVAAGLVMRHWPGPRSAG